MSKHMIADCIPDLHCSTGDFAAHVGAVNCLKIGRKSHGVLATGGEDKKVNLWAIGNSSAILVSG